MSLGDTQAAGGSPVIALPGHHCCNLLSPFCLLLSSLPPNLESRTDTVR